MTDGTRRPAVSLAELTKLQDQLSKPDPLTYDEVHDFALAALVVLRGLPRKDKLKVIARMRRLMG